MYTHTESRLRTLPLLRVLVLAVTLGLSLAAPAAASSSSVSYTVTGTGSSVPGSGTGCLDCQAPAMNASGTAACSVCIAGKPTSGSFTINLGIQTFPPSPCKVKSVSGTLQMNWSDGTISTAAVSGKFHDSKALALTGAFAATDPTYAGDATTLLLNDFPPSPCLAATNPITGTLALTL
jgi:hypothetical protein